MRNGVYVSICIHSIRHLCTYLCGSINMYNLHTLPYCFINKEAKKRDKLNVDWEYTEYVIIFTQNHKVLR